MTASATSATQQNTDIGLGLTAPPRDIRLTFTVRDPEIILELWRRDEGEPRDNFAMAALRLGVLALRQASGVIDTDTIRQEGERLLMQVRELLVDRSNQLVGSLREYFDPATGQLPQRLERLLKHGGDLETLLNQHVGGDTCTLARTLAQHVGESSPLLKMLSPGQNGGVISALTQVIQQALDQQRDQVLRQFSLDDSTSALARLLQQIGDANGKFRTDLKEDITGLSQEFSLDNQEGALARLVGKVEQAQRSIVAEFSNDNENSVLCRMTKKLAETDASVRSSLTLDNDKSPLYRLRRELIELLDGQSKANQAFHTEVRAALESMKARRETAERSTLHGGDFQNALGSILRAEAQRLGDVFEDVSALGGLSSSKCKIGDHVITLGPDSAAPDARIVCEAKAATGYSVNTARAEIQSARENRRAQVGIFVFSSTCAPAGIEPLTRHGHDIIAVWDQNDPASDFILKCAVSLARAVAVRQAGTSQNEASFEKIDAVLQSIGAEAEALKKMRDLAGTIEGHGKTLKEQAEKVRLSLEKQRNLLETELHRLKSAKS